MPAEVFRSDVEGDDDDQQSLERAEANPGSQRLAKNSVFTKHDMQVLI
jgi:hypothetical protein